MNEKKRRIASSKPASSTILGETLRRYRQEHHLSQEELAFTLNVEVRTLRRYERGEAVVKNVSDIRRFADTLGLPAEKFGLASTSENLRTPEDIANIITRIWDVVDEGSIKQAEQIATQLIKNLQASDEQPSRAFLTNIAHAYHAGGYVVSQNIRADESYKAIPYYEKMEEIARELENDTLLNIALTYIGDMYNRLGEYEKARTYLEAARDTTPHADKDARGNGIQLLARVYLRQGKLGEYEYAMSQAEELAYNIDPTASSTRGHYTLGTVYEEWGRNYGKMGQIQKAIEYLERARQALPDTAFWRLLIETGRAIALVKGGEIRSGVELAIATTEECYKYGIIRYLDRIHYIDHYLDKLSREINQVRSPLREVLDGGDFSNF